MTLSLGIRRSNFARSLSQPGEHERGLSGLFDGRVQYDGSGPVLDCPLVLIAFTNRCGSSLFAELLVQSGAFGGGGEFLNTEVVREMRSASGASTLPDHVAKLARSSCDGDQAFVLKTSWEQMAMLARWNIPAMFQSVHVLHVFRDDCLAQAVSYSIALQTGQWNAKQGRQKSTVDYRENELLNILERQSRDNAHIRALTAALGWPRMLICYEALTTNPAHHVSQSQAFCGLKKRDFEPKPTHHTRQSNELNAEFTARLRRSLQSTVLDHPDARSSLPA